MTFLDRMGAPASEDNDLKSQINHAPTSTNWSHEWDWPLAELGEFENAGKRLGNKQLSKYQCIKEPLADTLEKIGEVDAATAMRGCGCFMILHRFERGTLFRAMNECNHLVCPTAQRRRAAKLVESKGAALERFIRKHPGSQPLMGTLTTKSVPAYDLWVAVSQILEAFRKLMRRVAIKRAFPAWIRSLEVTRNPHTLEFMVHLHCIFMAGPNYFKPGSKEYLTHAKLRSEWKSCLRVDYDPQVHITALKGNFAPLDKTGRKSLKECLKYCFKPAALFYTKQGGKPGIVGATTRELFDANDGKGLRWMTHVPLRAIIQALKDRRLVESSGNLKGDADLDFNDDPDADAKAIQAELGDFICTEIYAWRVVRGEGDFFLVSRSFERPTNAGGFAMGP